MDIAIEQQKGLVLGKVVLEKELIHHQHGRIIAFEPVKSGEYGPSNFILSEVMHLLEWYKESTIFQASLTLVPIYEFQVQYYFKCQWVLKARTLSEKKKNIMGGESSDFVG